MSLVSPFYSLQQLIYHSHSECPQAQSITLTSQRAGTGGKVACLCCRRLTKLSAKKGRLPGLSVRRIREKPRSRTERPTIEMAHN